MGWFQRAANVFRGGRHSREIDREISFHIQETTDRLVAGGMSPARAEREARRRFGHRTTLSERIREMDILLWLEVLVGDLRYAVRALGRAPAFTLVAVLSLGLGIGANTAIFSLLNAVLLRSLPVQQPEQLVKLAMDESSNDVLTNPLWEELNRQDGVFNGVFAWSGQRFNLAQSGQARTIDGELVSGGYFSTLGITPAAGRLLQPDDDRRGCPAVAVASYGFWQSEFGGVADAIGRSIAVNGQTVTLVGVVSRGFNGVEVGRFPQLYLPLCTEPLLDGAPGMLDERSAWWLQVMGRIPPGGTEASVAARMAALSPAIFRATLPSDWGAEGQQDYLKRTFKVYPATTGFSDVRSRYQTALVILMAVVGVVLLIACANVANLLLARAAARQREIAMRMAIGASRGRIVRQMLTESILLAALGGVVGLCFALWSTNLLVGMIGNRGGEVFLDLSLDGRVLGFTLLLAVLTGVLFGVAPAWRSARLDPQVALKAQGTNTTATAGTLAAGKLLVVAQVALSLVLVATAGLLLGTFRALTTVDPGFSSDNVYLAEVPFSQMQVSDSQRKALAGQLLERLRAAPVVASASASVIVPVSGRGWNSFVLADGYQPASQYENLVWFNGVTDGYFATMGTPVVAGREFTAPDGAGPRYAVINRAMARRVFGAKNPIGERIWVSNENHPQPPMEIIGIVEDAKYRALRDSTAPTVYVPWTQAEHFGSLSYEVRSRAGATESVAAILAAAKTVLPNTSLEISTLSGQLSASLARERLLATLSGFFGALALLLALIGQYGTMAYNVACRRKELGIRVALGASRPRLVGLVLGEVGRMVLVGLVLGATATFAATRLVSAFLYGRTPLDPVTLALATLAVAGTAVLAGAIPAVRAARQDPQAVLREE